MLESTMDEAVVFGVLVFALVMFVMGKWRYDIVALASLLILAVLGIVPPSEAYLGFGHPAVVTVAAVLILSRALYNSGVVDVIASWYLRIPNYLPVRITSLSVLGAFLSAFMNNVGAVSLLMPVTMRVAGRSKHPPSLFLMPLAFASLLGGMITLIGTPPNIIASNIRLEESGVPFNMFDFTLVGLGVALAGVTFIVLVGWRLLPSRTAPLTMGDALHIEDYMTEVRVPEDSRFVGKMVRDLEELTEDDVAIVGLLHKGVVHGAPSSYQIIDSNDIFIIEADPEEIKTFVDKTGFALEGSSRDIQAEIDETLTGRDVAMVEVIVGPDSRAEGGTAHGLHLHESFGVNLLGVSRRGTRIMRHLGGIIFKVGDVLLLQGKKDLVHRALPRLGLLPLAERELRIGQQRQLFFPLAVFVAAVLLTSFGVLSVQISFVVAVAVLLITRFLSLEAAYQAIDWPVIILLGAMIPVGEALETTGGAARIAMLITESGGALPPWAVLGVMLVATMLLSSIINNAAAVILMAPIGIGVAHTLGASSDPFLMAVAIGGSSAFLTPIGHQSNTIVMGPGGYHFGDYWRMGLPLVIVIVAVAIPLLMWVWPMGI